MSKKPSLLHAALKSAGKPAVTETAAIIPEKAAEPEAKPASAYVPPSRAGKVSKTHHLPRPYWETFEELSFRTRDEQGKRMTQEKLMMEALNLLFHKYNYPQVRE